MILRSAKKRIKFSSENQDINENLKIKCTNIIEEKFKDDASLLKESFNIEAKNNSKEFIFNEKINIESNNLIDLNEDIDNVKNIEIFKSNQLSLKEKEFGNKEEIKNENIKKDFFNLHFNYSDEFNEDYFIDYEKRENKIEILNFKSNLGRCKFVHKNLNNNQKFNLNDFTKIEDLSLNKRLLDFINKDKITNLQKDILNIICSYKDLMFSEYKNDDSNEILFSYCLHIINHIIKTRTRVINNNQKLKKNESNDLEFKDQGFTRPKVLILVPFKNSAFKLVNLLIKIFVGKKTLQNREFKKINEKNKKIGDDIIDSDKNEELIETDEISKGSITIMNYKKFKSEFYKDDEISAKKSDDYKVTFAGNNEEYFRIGIEFTKKSCKLYSKFYSSDIILASPLGLRTIIGAEGEKKRDFDFLSSIEILVLDQTEIFLMQNWEHVLHLMNHLNLQPKDHHNVDFSRIRMWSLDGFSKYFRQTIIFSSIKSIYISSLFMNNLHNYEGKIIQSNYVSNQKAFICKVLVNMEHKFHRFSNRTLEESADNRFKYFIENIIPKFNKSSIGHTLIFIPSYFDYLRIRNYMRKEEISFTHICEHTEKGKMAQSRKWFFMGQRTFLLYTERAHFYNRYYIKGIHHLIFYQLPTYPNFYFELCNLLIENNQRKDFINDGRTFDCTVLYDKFDNVQLVNILGNTKSKELLDSFISTYTFKSNQNII